MFTVTADFGETAEKHDTLASNLLSADNCDQSEMKCQKSDQELADAAKNRKEQVEKDVSFVTLLICLYFYKI